MGKKKITDNIVAAVCIQITFNRVFVTNAGRHDKIFLLNLY